MIKNYIIGRIEKIDIPLFEIKDLEVKIDTGAYTSSIDCYKISQEGKLLKFKVLDDEHPLFTNNWYVFENWKTTKVTSSNGQEEERYLINLDIKFGDEVVETEFTLSNRSKMKYPVLIGRKTIPKGWLVDVHQ
jgi:hypothetical protein